MKKKHILSLHLCLLICCLSYGQHSSIYDSWTGADGDHFKIQEYEYPYTISLYTQADLFMYRIYFIPQMNTSN